MIDRRRGLASGRRAPVDQVEFVLEQYRTRYWDFTGQRNHGPRDRAPDAERSCYRCEDMGRQQGKDHAYRRDGAKGPTAAGEDSCVEGACSKRDAG